MVSSSVFRGDGGESASGAVKGGMVSKRSLCGAVRICLEPDEPSAGIVRVEALSLWRRANLS